MTFRWRQKAILTIGLIALSVIFGPFTTGDLPLPQRLIYWSAVIGSLAVFMNLLLFLSLTHPEMRRFHYLPIVLGAVALAAVPGALVVASAELALRGVVLSPRSLIRIWFAVVLIGFVIALASYPPGARRHRRRRDRTPDPEIPGRAFLNRLDPGMGTDLVSLSAEDHVLDVVTRDGRQDLIMSLDDAVADLSDYPGHRIHPDHWVAADQITRIDGDSVLTTADARLPVSEDRLPALRAAYG